MFSLLSSSYWCKVLKPWSSWYVVLHLSVVPAQSNIFDKWCISKIKSASFKFRFNPFPKIQIVNIYQAKSIYRITSAIYYYGPDIFSKLFWNKFSHSSYVTHSKSTSLEPQKFLIRKLTTFNFQELVKFSRESNLESKYCNESQMNLERLASNVNFSHDLISTSE